MKAIAVITGIILMVSISMHAKNSDEAVCNEPDVRAKMSQAECIKLRTAIRYSRERYKEEKAYNERNGLIP